MQREDTVEEYLVKRVERVGGMAEKFKSPGRSKVPDRLITLPLGWLCFVETKRPGSAAKFPANAHERAQARDHDRRRALGQRVEVIDSKAQVDALIAEWVSWTHTRQRSKQ